MTVQDIINRIKTFKIFNMNQDAVLTDAILLSSINSAVSDYYERWSPLKIDFKITTESGRSKYSVIDNYIQILPNSAKLSYWTTTDSIFRDIYSATYGYGIDFDGSGTIDFDISLTEGVYGGVINIVGDEADYTYNIVVPNGYGESLISGGSLPTSATEYTGNFYLADDTSVNVEFDVSVGDGALNYHELRHYLNGVSSPNIRVINVLNIYSGTTDITNNKLRKREFNKTNSTGYDWWGRERNDLYLQSSAGGAIYTIQLMYIPEYTATTQTVEFETSSIDDILLKVNADLELSYGDFNKHQALINEYERRKILSQSRNTETTGDGYLYHYEF